MARNSTDMVFALYGKDVNASKVLKGVGDGADTASHKFKSFGRVAAASFLAIGGAAAGFAISAAKAAVEDEKSQKMLAKAIKNTAGATDAQVQSTENFIGKMQLSYGIADDKLRPAFATLTRVTGNLTESQDLMQVAMDVSAGTGKDLTTVSLALAKAHEGNLGSLKKLGIPLDDSIVKNKDFNAALTVLTETFNGSAKAGAETFAGRMEVIKQNVNEAKEQIGYALMPILEKMAKYIIETVVPNVQAFVDGLTGKDGATGAVDGAHESVRKFGEGVRGVFKWLADHKHIIVEVAAAFAMFWAVGKIGAAVSAISAAFRTIRGVLMATEAVAVGTAAAEAAAAGPGAPAILLAQALAAGAVFAAFGLSSMWTGISGAGKQPPSKQDRQLGIGYGPNASTYLSPATAHQGTPNGMIWFNGAQVFEQPFMHTSAANQAMVGSHTVAPGTRAGHPADGQPGGLGHRALGGSVAAGASYLVGENGPEILTMGGNGFVTPNNRLGGMGMNVVVNVSGSVIQERDLAVTVRDHIAQLMRRRGLDPAILGV